ncbi:DedA family protein [Polymorphobacter sp.]|uniref:DedA family protein n=1 Tax=Polymorphobacter sp. TaxID=1909290 RepID=UPI003F7137F1
MFDRLIALLDQTGYVGIAALMFLENLFPPIPSELIMPSAGFSAGQGKLSLVGVILSGTMGSVAGALFWYFVGKWIGAYRLKRWAACHGRWLTLKPRDVDRVDHWFDTHAGKAVFFGRLIPAIRTLISVPAGIFGMPLPWFLLYSTLGSLAWTAFLAGAGYLLQGQHEQVSAWLNPVTNVVIGLIVVTYLVRVFTWRAH